jgi:branched-chain amino acid transport system substrate-binding protein
MRCPVVLLLAALAVSCERKAPPAAADTAPVARTASEPDVLLLGEVGSLTGTQATFGISSRNGFELALDEANAAGGVRGKKLALRVYDSQGRPEEAAQAATRLITQDRVLIILGETSSSCSMAMAEKAQPAHVPMISHAATNPAVTEKGDYIFRVCFIDPFQGSVMARFARQELKLERVAQLRDSKNAYSVGLTQVFAREFTRLGGEVLATESYSEGDTDFRSQLTALKKLKPQAVYVPGYYTDVGLIARQAREQGLTVPLLGSDGWDSERLFELAGDALEGGYFTNPYALDDPSPRVQEFIARYKRRYGSVPDSTAVLAYDAARVAFAALARAPDLSGPALRDAIARTRDFPGVAGTITLDEHRNAVKSAVILKVSRGGTRFVKSIPP